MDIWCVGRTHQKINENALETTTCRGSCHICAYVIEYVAVNEWKKGEDEKQFRDHR